MESFEKIKQEVTAMEQDIEKAKAGNKSAVTRVRKSAMEIKNAAHELRKEALESK